MTIAFVHDNHSATTSTNTITTTLVSTTAGNSLRAFIWGRDVTVSSMPAGWAKILGDAALFDFELWGKDGIAGGLTSVVATYSGTPTNNEGITDITEWSGLSATTDGTNHASDSNGSTSFAVGMSGATTNANDLILAAYVNQSGWGTTTASGFTMLSYMASANYHLQAAYKIVSATGTYTATFLTTGPNTAPEEGLIAAFKASSLVVPKRTLLGVGI